MMKDDRDAATSYIGGLFGADSQVLHYFSMAACSSSPPETVLLSLLSDDRLLARGPELQAGMFDDFKEICNLPDLLWRRLAMVVGGGTSPQQLRTDAIYATATACGYMDTHVFDILTEDPWMQTQGNIRLNVEEIGRTPLDELVDETVRKIKIGLDNEIPIHVFVKGLQLLRQTSCTTNVDEQAHGRAAKLHSHHHTLSYEHTTVRSTISSLQSLFLPNQYQWRIQTLFDIFLSPVQ